MIYHSKVVKYCSERQRGFQWIFNPALSPWMGGAWEPLIKSVKISLKAIRLDRMFTEEALSTFLCGIEFIASQRPLTAISDDITDYDILTPNQIIKGETNANLTTGQVI